MKIILLPGLDGTGLLFEPFEAITPAGFSVDVLPLDQMIGQDAASQAERFESVLPDEPFILLAESYSGLVAYELLQRTGYKNLLHVIFVASFLRAPTKLANLATYLPASFIDNQFLLEKVASRLVFGKYRSDELVKLFYGR